MVKCSLENYLKYKPSTDTYEIYNEISQGPPIDRLVVIEGGR